jgi:hypothetical protein
MEDIVRKTLMLAAAFFLFAGSSLAQTEIVETTTQKWVAGWDHFAEPLNLTKSSVKWSIATTRKMTVTFTLSGATPNKLYQVGIHLFCTTSPGTFGQFPTNPATGPCGQLTRQNVTAAVASVEMGVVTTDMHGNGSFKVVVGPIASGTYHAEFTVRDGAGCNLIGGSGNTNCAADFQSPGPFGTTTALAVP